MTETERLKAVRDAALRERVAIVADLRAVSAARYETGAASPATTGQVMSDAVEWSRPMTETERLKAAGVSAVDAAYAAWQATVNSANTARAAYNAICKIYNAALAAQDKETDR